MNIISKVYSSQSWPLFVNKLRKNTERLVHL